MKLILIITAFLLTLSLCPPKVLRMRDFITEWWNVPYRYGGATKAGIDCSKFVQRLYEEVYNIEIPGVSWEQWKASKRIQKDSLKTGDIVFFSSRKSPSGWHVGVYLCQNLFIHSSNKRENIKISSLDEENYRRNYKGAGRIQRAGKGDSLECECLFPTTYVHNAEKPHKKE